MSTSITELKAQLGLNIPRLPLGNEPAVVLDLFKGFAKINQDYADHKAPQVRGSDAIRNDASRLFEELGPALWPDLDKEAGIPSWLSKPSGDSRRYYYYSIDRDYLADRFYELVCGKLNQHHGNVQSRKRKTNPSLESEESFDGGEIRSIEHTDLSVRQDGTKDGLNSVAKHPTSRKTKARNKDNIPLAIDREPTQSTTPTPAADLNDQRLMGQTPTKLFEAQSKLQHSKLDQYMAQRGGPDGMDLDQPDNSSADFEITPAGMRRRSSSVYEMPQSLPRYMGQSEGPLAHTTQSTKRPLSDGKRDRKTKRNKNHSDVQTAKQTLVVVLKLTQGKGVSERPKTVPPQQPHVLRPSVEADEIAVRHASTLASRCDTVASDTGVGDERTSIPPAIPNQDQRNDTSEAAMDAPCDLNDTGSAYEEATEPIAPAGGTIRPASAVLSPPNEAHKQRESHVMVEFRRIWSDEAYEIVHEILTTSLSKHTPEELVFAILLPVLKQIRDQLPSTIVSNDPFSTSNDAHEHLNAKPLDSQQQELVALRTNVGPFDTASQIQPVEGTSPSSKIDALYASSSAPMRDDRNMPVQPIGSQSCSPIATGSLGAACETAKGEAHSDERLRKTSPAASSLKAVQEENAAAKVTRDADQTPTFDYNRLVRGIDLKILIDRNDGLEPKEIGIIDIEDILDSNDFFKAVLYEYGWRLGSDEEFSAARVTEADESSGKWPRTDLSLRHATRRDRSWYRWLSELRVYYERERVVINMDLVARVLVTRKNDAKS